MGIGVSTAAGRSVRYMGKWVGIKRSKGDLGMEGPVVQEGCFLGTQNSRYADCEAQGTPHKSHDAVELGKEDRDGEEAQHGHDSHRHLHAAPEV